MTRIIDVDMECRCKKVNTALNKFFKKYPNLEYWRETFEYMAENGIDHLSDVKQSDGSEDWDNWCWAINLDIEEDWIYIGIIERA